jgi:hypothetical protein
MAILSERYQSLHFGYIFFPPLLQRFSARFKTQGQKTSFHLVRIIGLFGSSVISEGFYSSNLQLAFDSTPEPFHPATQRF